MAKRWTLLSIVQEVCRRQNLALPTSVTSSQDETILQLWGLLNEEIDELKERGDWKERHTRVVFQHANGPEWLAWDLSQRGLVPPGKPGTIAYIVKDTMYDITSGMPVAGPLSDQDWQAMITQNVAGAAYSWRMSTLGVCIYPVPIRDPLHFVEFSFEGVMREVVRPASSGFYREVFEADDDEPVLPGSLVVSGLRWRYRREKGLPYAELKDSYEMKLVQALTVDQGNPVTSMCGDGLFPEVVKPGLLVPAGNWNV